jgi:hypothetical protein
MQAAAKVLLRIVMSSPLCQLQREGKDAPIKLNDG